MPKNGERRLFCLLASAAKQSSQQQLSFGNQPLALPPQASARADSLISIRLMRVKTSPHENRAVHHVTPPDRIPEPTASGRGTRQPARNISASVLGRTCMMEQSTGHIA